MSKTTVVPETMRYDDKDKNNDECSVKMIHKGTTKDVYDTKQGIIIKLKINHQQLNYARDVFHDYFETRRETLTHVHLLPVQIYNPDNFSLLVPHRMTLHTYLKHHVCARQLSLSDRLDILYDLTDALTFLHRRSIVLPRIDINRNIFVCPSIPPPPPTSSHKNNKHNNTQQRPHIQIAHYPELFLRPFIMGMDGTPCTETFERCVATYPKRHKLKAWIAPEYLRFAKTTTTNTLWQQVYTNTKESNVFELAFVFWCILNGDGHRDDLQDEDDNDDDKDNNKTNKIEWLNMLIFGGERMNLHTLDLGVASIAIPLTRLITRMWSHVPTDRPSMSVIQDVLAAIRCKDNARPIVLQTAFRSFPTSSS